jgi:NDP-sugar pyrophosphorylase family protein
MQLIIPMSGVGKRFQDNGYKLPKPFIQISGKPMIQHVVEMFPGIENVLFIVNREHFEDSTLGLEARLLEISPNAEIAVIDSHKLGPAWAIYQARNSIKLEVPVVVNYCDFACIWDSFAFREQLKSGVDGLIATYSGFHPHMLRNTQYAYLRLNEFGILSDIQEKIPFTYEPMKEPASSGTYGFRTGQVLIEAVAAQIAANDSYNNEFYSSLTYKNMLSSGKIIKSFEIEKFFQWGTPHDFEDFKWQKEFFTFKSSKKERFIESNRVEILAAGNGKRFSDFGYSIEKPFLPLGKTFLVMEALKALGEPKESIGVLLQEKHRILPECMSELGADKINIRRVAEATRGQAESALISLTSETKGSCIVGTCDSLVFPMPESKLGCQVRTLGVWVNKPSEFAVNNPSQFGWVTLSSDGEITNSWVKVVPKTTEELYVISGTFFFGDDREAIALLESFLRSGTTINMEFYLDSLLAFAKEHGWKVIGLIPEWFVSLGTPNEYETYRYWESVFASRPDLLVPDAE